MRRATVVSVWLMAAMAFCLLPALMCCAADVHEAPGWQVHRGFDVAAIENPGDLQEPDWSAWLATQMSLDPTKVCEVRTRSGARVDILTDSQAIEVEWVWKWYESVGQSLHYSIETHRPPAIILLDAGMEDAKIAACSAVCQRTGIALYVQRVPARK